MAPRTHIDEDGTFFAFGKDGTVVGKMRDDNTAQLISIFVEPNKRRHHLGTVLLDLFIGWARDSGAKDVVVDYKPQSGFEGASAQFYKKQGFITQKGSKFSKEL